MRLKAILICSRRPVIVTIHSGHEASDMFIFAPLYKKSYKHYSNGKGMKYVYNIPKEKILKLDIFCLRYCMYVYRSMSHIET